MKHYFMPRHDLDWGGVVVSSPLAGTISVKLGVPVSGRAASRPTQPDGAPPVVMSLR